MTKRDKEDFVIEPRMARGEKSVPGSGLLLVNPVEAARWSKELIASGALARPLFNSSLTVSKKGDFFLAGPAIGAPMAAMTMEKLIALGATRIILCGWCGALDPSLAIGDVVVPDSGLSGEGCSQYYAKSRSVLPSQPYSTALAGSFTEQGVVVQRGRVWSTDAIYREKRGFLQRLHQEASVKVVDMEFTALCSVAALRGIDFAASLVVSDKVHGKNWKPGFTKKQFKDRARAAIEAALRFTRVEA